MEEPIERTDVLEVQQPVVLVSVAYRHVSLPQAAVVLSDFAHVTKAAHRVLDFQN